MATAVASSEDETQSKSPKISFINSQKGKQLLIANEYIFKLNKTTTTTKYWKCVVNSCSAKIHTDVNVREFREKVKQREVNETAPIPRIYDEECAKAKLSDATTAILPSEREMNSGINKSRRAMTPTISTTQLFDIPEPFTKTLHDDDFLIVDKMITRRQRIFLFASREQLKMLLGADTILMDGTFSTYPSMFDQVYTMDAIKYDQSFPCVFGLLPNQLKTTYHFMFQELKSIAMQMQLNFTPKSIMSDFERALITVIAAEFVGATHSSCYFHFTQAVYRAIHRVGLSTSYNNGNDIKHSCRKLMALALLPEPIIEDTYDELLAAMSIEIKNKLNDLLQYFQGQWCVHGFSMRTNNNAEAFHSRFNRRVQLTHPNMWSFIKFLQGDENRFHHLRIQFYAGLGARSKQAKTIAIQRHIDNLGQRYYDGVISAMEYLDGLSYTVAKRKK
ncbi:unnamed protein product [Rotaria socialis]|uniref:MULE transposase domain-containing protein n=1 Tax=Rotaria socialis TaxID=392032 RepID=A0A820TLY6_9BILA|nr:unnamed protein product [Rotaria socialis]CAF4439566.1 unnamed protein product [Rotaria socialis]CAF4473740.1 unnamed protein product [Rotaria socialis]